MLWWWFPTLFAKEHAPRFERKTLLWQSRCFCYNGCLGSCTVSVDLNNQFDLNNNQNPLTKRRRVFAEGRNTLAQDSHYHAGAVSLWYFYRVRPGAWIFRSNTCSVVLFPFACSFSTLRHRWNIPRSWCEQVKRIKRPVKQAHRNLLTPTPDL